MFWYVWRISLGAHSPTPIRFPSTFSLAQIRNKSAMERISTISLAWSLHFHHHMCMPIKPDQFPQIVQSTIISRNQKITSTNTKKKKNKKRSVLRPYYQYIIRTDGIFTSSSFLTNLHSDGVLLNWEFGLQWGQEPLNYRGVVWVGPGYLRSPKWRIYCLIFVVLTADILTNARQNQVHWVVRRATYLLYV